MKKFLIVGNVNAVTYKEIFPLIKNNEMWLGPSITSGGRRFDVPESYPLEAADCGIDEDGTRFIRVNGIRWFTNLDHQKKHKPIELTKHYSPDVYQKYNNYDAINVDKVKDIPIDYNGVMGVPISFLDKYCPEQFEIVGSPNANVVPEGWKGMSKEFVDLYYAQGGTAQYREGYRLEHYVDRNGKVVIPYKRILIKRK